MAPSEEESDATLDRQARLGDLEEQASVVRADIDDLERQAAVDRAVISQLQDEGVVDREKIAQLEVALIAARRIGAAIGVLMAIRQLTDLAAFEVLRVESQRTHRKLRDVAEDVLRTGDLTQR